MAMSIRNFVLMLSISLAGFSVMAGHHQNEHMEHSDMTHEQSASSCADDDSCDMTHGIVVSLNKEKRKIVLNHEEIKSINMSPMTMPFSVERVSLMQDLVKGDHVFFYVENVGGELIIKRMVKDNK
tara:strand:+ start:14202 stop:14579 length:378 start_codon:yes stop_codon:yes gene_type:complete